MYSGGYPLRVSAAISHFLAVNMKNYKSRTDPKGTTRKRALLLFVAFSLFLTYLLGSILSMELLSYDYYQDKVLSQITTTSSLRAKRGTIYDANGNVLAESITEWRIFLSPVDIYQASKEEEIDYAAKIAECLAPTLDLSYDTIYKKASNRSVIDETLIKRADEDTYRRVTALVSKEGLSDMVHTEAFYTRYYPGGDFLCQVLGFTGSDGQGLFGLEYSYDTTLTGKDGYYLYAKDTAGNEMPNQYVSYVAAEDGNSIVTTIDSYIQGQLEYAAQGCTIEVTGTVAAAFGILIGGMCAVVVSFFLFLVKKEV